VQADICFDIYILGHLPQRISGTRGTHTIDNLRQKKTKILIILVLSIVIDIYTTQQYTRHTTAPWNEFICSFNTTGAQAVSETFEYMNS